MKKGLFIAFFVVTWASCKKSDSAPKLRITDLGFEYNVKYYIQQRMRISNNPIVYSYPYMRGPVQIIFTEDSASEIRPDAVSTWSYKLKGKGTVNGLGTVAYDVEFKKASPISPFSYVFNTGSENEIMRDGDALEVYSVSGSDYSIFRFVK